MVVRTHNQGLCYLTGTCARAHNIVHTSSRGQWYISAVFLPALRAARFFLHPLKYTQQCFKIFKGMLVER